MAIQSSEQYEERAMSLLRAEKAREALAVFEEGARRFPGDEDLLLGAAMAYSRMGEHARALEVLEDLRARNPQSGEVLLGLVETQLARGLPAAAARMAREWAQSAGDAKALYRLARTFYSWRRYREALPYYERAAGLAAQWSEAWFGLGACRWSLSQAAGAEAALRRTIELEPKYWLARQFLGCVLHDLGRKKEARQMLESVPLDAPWQKPALERLVAMSWWPSEPRRGEAMETLWRKVMGGAAPRGARDVLEEVSRKLDEPSS